ncbi:MAG: ABC transporter permease subunit [Oligoflexia bacterium]|nr:ABC transporter permease subunit [Oligoflexia bacterium]
MIEKLTKNPLTLKRWKVFKSRRASWISLWFFLFFLFLSLTAELWSNSKPLILHYQDAVYFPILKKYSPETFSLKDQHLTNYRELELKEGDWALWPLVKWNPLESNLTVKKFPSPPSSSNWLGTDDRGRDVLARLLYGYRYSIGFALCAWFFSYIIGSLAGALMGYFGAKIDMIGQRLVEVIDALPFLIILITLTTVIGRSFIFMVLFMSFFSWVGISLYMRAEFLRLRKRPFVEASRALGKGHWGLILKQILPNALNPIITFSPFALAGFISALAALDYLGFGLMPPTPSWGELFSQAEKHVTTAWWLALFPSIALFSALLSLTFIGNGMRDAFDPKEH